MKGRTSCLEHTCLSFDLFSVFLLHLKECIFTTNVLKLTHSIKKILHLMRNVEEAKIVS